MQRLTQIHSDRSMGEITFAQNSWRVRLSIHRPDGSELVLVGIQAGTLDEAQELASTAMAREHGTHVCDGECQPWIKIEVVPMPGQHRK